MCKIILMALIAAVSSVHAQQFNLAPNGDFEIAGGDEWISDQLGGTWSFPATGGNADGYAEFDFTSPGTAWGGVLISSDGATAPFLSLASLGLAIGDTPVLQWDAMTNVQNTYGGVKIEAYDAAGSLISVANDGVGSGYNFQISQAPGTWSTYSSTGNFVIPAATDSVKIVVTYNQGFGAAGNVKIGFDNVGVYGSSPIPEPTVYGLLAGIAALGHVMLRRRR
jgi:hypothetical protein